MTSMRELRGRESRLRKSVQAAKRSAIYWRRKAVDTGSGRAQARRRKAETNLADRRRELAEVREQIARQGNVRATVTFDGVPTMRGLAYILQDAREHGWRGSLNSSDRREGVAEAHGKMSQAKLFRCAQAKRTTGRCPPECHGNCNPANPPGHSSHELRGDGVIAPDRAALPWYKLGLDLADAEGFTRVARSRGFDIRRLYASASEAHHRNVMKDPTPRLRKLGYI